MKSRRGILLVLAGVVAALTIGWCVFPAALYRAVEQPLHFSHAVHAGETVGLACGDCHEFEANGQFAGLPTLEKCTGCHSTVLGESPDEKILVERYVSPNHEIPWHVYSRQPQNVYFSHVHHVKSAEIPCERCHGPHGSSDRLRPVLINRISGYSRDIWGSSMSRIGKQPWDGMKMDDCAGCHTERGTSIHCLTCHK